MNVSRELLHNIVSIPHNTVLHTYQLVKRADLRFIYVSYTHAHICFGKHWHHDLLLKCPSKYHVFRGRLVDGDWIIGTLYIS